MDTNGAAAGAVAAPTPMPNNGVADTDNRTGTAAGTYDQPAGGGHNWGWIGIFGLLGLFGLGGRSRTTLTEDTAAARPTVNTRL
jgi:MYXO-CTERM domain-containing protein